MHSKRKVIAIPPAFNEESRIGQVVKKISKDVVDVICVVDDGSTDRTAAVAKEAGADIVISHKQRRGLGSAIRTGIDYAISNHFEIIVILAGNDKDNPAEIPLLLDPIVKEDYDYVQGSRYLEGGRYGQMPLHRVIGTRLYPILLNIATLGKSKASDATNGFRAYKTSLFQDKRLNIWQDWLDGTELEFYLHYQVVKYGYKIKEVPVSKLYLQVKKYKEYTKVKPIVDWWKILKPLVCLTLKIKS
ncbi:MAG: glycosyltransferase family 2 protein [bacterium]